MLRKLGPAATLALTSTALWAHEFTVGDLEISHPHAFEIPPMAIAGRGFVTITNTSDIAGRLIAMRADFRIQRILLLSTEKMVGL